MTIRILASASPALRDVVKSLDIALALRFRQEGTAHVAFLHKDHMSDLTRWLKRAGWKKTRDTYTSLPISVSGALFIVKMSVRPDGNDLRLALTESTK